MISEKTKSKNKSVPILLINKKLRKPILLTSDKIKNIEDIIVSDNHPEIVLQGLFVLLVSSFEIMLSDILKYYLTAFPHKLDNSEMKFSKDDVLGNFTNSKLLTLQIDDKINSIFYKKLSDVIDYFFVTLSIDEPAVDQNYIDKIVEIKETRNLLLHNDLVVNSSYLEKAGKLKRSDRIGERLRITKNYLGDALKNISDIIKEIEKRIQSKYSHYTKIKVLRELWSFLFSSPVMPFDDFWEVSEEEDGIILTKKGRYEEQISNSERMFLGMWRAHFNQNPKNLVNFSMYSLDSEHKDKMLYFLSIIDEIRLD